MSTKPKRASRGASVWDGDPYADDGKPLYIYLSIYLHAREREKRSLKMTINDLVSTLTDDTEIMIHDSHGAEVFPQGFPGDMPEFMYDYTVRSVQTCGAGVISVVIDDETYLQAFAIMQELASDLYDLEDCRSLSEIDSATVEHLRDIEHTARRMALNIRRGKPWRDGIFPTCDRLR